MPYLRWKLLPQRHLDKTYKENTNVSLVIGVIKSLKPFKCSTCSSDFKIKAKFEKAH